MLPPRHFRAHGRRRVELRGVVRDPAARWAEAAWIVDLGLGGACLEIDARIDSDSPVVIELVAPTLWEPLRLAAKVVWSSDAGGPRTRLGLRFEHRDAASLYALFELIGASAFEA